MADKQEYDSATSKLEAMMSGDYNYETEESEADEPEVIEEDIDVEDTESEEEVEHDEDTDLEEEELDSDPDDAETNEHDDGIAEETADDETEEDEDEPEENAPVDDDTENATEEVKDADPEAESEEVNYQTKYEELLAESETARNFYEKATSEFTAGGKIVKGFTDPEKVIQSQQMSYGFNDKMSVFKKNKPYLKALQESGMIEDREKFDLFMSMAKGDKEAFKQHAKNQNWDLMEMDMDSVNYEGKPQIPSDMELALDDVLENAGSRGVQSRMEKVLGKEWDSGSVVQLLDRPQDSAILVDHMENGIYDAVQERISEKARIDVNGVFTGRSNYDQYMIASQELDAEYRAYTQEQAKQRENQLAEADKVAQAKAKIEQERKDAEYKAAAQAKEKEANEARAKATRMSKPKNKPKRSVKKVDKMALTGDDFQAYFNREILGMS